MVRNSAKSANPITYPRMIAAFRPVKINPAATSSSEIPIVAGDMLTLSAPTPHGRQK
jgi:hypothetical protein